MTQDSEDECLRFIHFEGRNLHEIFIKQGLSYFVVCDAKGRVSLLSESNAGSLENAVALVAYEPSAKECVIIAYTPKISKYESALENRLKGVRLSTARVPRGEFVTLFYWSRNSQNGSTLTKEKPGAISFKIDI
jgi:hypothetical protein